MRTFFICIVAGALFLSIPLVAGAAVIINEIAWMGTAVSASDEWIELANDGTESVSLAGWKLVAEDGAPSISLAGEVPAGGFYLLERTDDTTVPDQAADKIYTGDLANGGETLALIDDMGTTIDAVVGGSGWNSVGGNNATKDTPQRQTDGTWLTGVPTPKAVNTTTPSQSGEVAGTSTPSTSTPKKSAVTGGYKQIVFAYAGEDMLSIAGADTFFEGHAVDDKNSRVSTTQFEWAFGDGGKGDGKERTHVYHEPGTYVVTLTVRGKDQKHRDRALVTVVPSGLHIKQVSDDGSYIEIENASAYDADISQWKLFVDYARGKKRTGSFTMPNGTTILAGASVRFPRAITKLSPGPDDAIALQFPSGHAADSPHDGVGNE